MARKKTAKKVVRKTTPRKTVTRSAPRVGGESALIGQGPSWWKLGEPVDPGFRRTAQDEQQSHALPPQIPVGIYPQARQPVKPTVEPGLEMFGSELGELVSEYLPDDLVPLDAELTSDVDDLLSGANAALDDLLSEVVPEVVPEIVPEIVPEVAAEVAPDVVDDIPEDVSDDDLDATEYFPPDVDGLLEVPQDLLDVVEKEMPVEDESAIADPADFVDLLGVDEEPGAELAAEEPPAEEPLVEVPPVEEPAAEEPPEPPVMEKPPVEPTPPASVEVPPAEPEPAPGPARRPLLVTVLQGLNYPLRVLSPSSRTVVDWVAWSLIFWVPVVWAIAIVVVGR